MSSQVSTRGRREAAQRDQTRNRSRRGGREAASQGEQENEGVKQNAEERRLLRSKYRELKQSITDHAEELVKLDSNRFHELVEKMDDLHSQVQKPREQIADAEAVLDITSSFLSNVKGNLRKNGVSPAAFVGALLATFGERAAGDNDEVATVDWGRLGLQAIGIVREAPGMSTMLGPMDIEPKVRQAPAPRNKRVKPTQSTRPEEVRERDEEAAKAETDANMETMFGVLRTQRRAQLDALVLNRRSFSQTVENIFSLSFLVKDGRVAITYNEDGTHFVVPKNAPTANDRQSGKATNAQFVFRYDWACWQSMQENLEDGAELMPDRGSTVDQETQPQDGTPIRKNSRNRGRETRKLESPDDEEDGEESEDEELPSRQRKRNQSLFDHR